MVVFWSMSRFLGPIFILISALLWGTDSLFRYSAGSKVDATWIVLIEHLGIAFLLPLIMTSSGKASLKMGWKETLLAIFAGAGGGAIATILFTASFQYVHPSVAVLLQKLQPVFTVMAASFFLNEKPSPSFYPWALLSLAAAILLSFPDLNFKFLMEPGNLHTRGILLTLAAAGIWSISTIAGKRLLQSVPVVATTFWRYFFGLITLISIVSVAQIPFPHEVLTDRNLQWGLIYLTVMTGIIPMLAYYAGLSRTSASVATFVELVYPLSAVALNAWLLEKPLSPIQMAAAGILLFAITMMNLF